jgi:3-phenylpropionate/trans-cinnamate dioxygenase ferredoxin reductase component
MIRRVVIAGAGHAGVQAAASLREGGYDGAIALVDAQTALPYQRPPLSKAFLKGETNAERLVLKGEGFYAEQNIDLMLGEAITGVDRKAQKLTLNCGATLAYDRLILATGARARALPIRGAELQGVHILRMIADASRIMEALSPAKSVAVIGGGFIGLEVAAAFAGTNREIHVVEAQDRLLSRAVSPAISQRLLAHQKALGVRVHLLETVAEIEGDQGRAKAVRLGSGKRLDAGLVLIAAGVLADDLLAKDAGLDIADGILVDAQLATSDPAIFAIGDVARHPSRFASGKIRLESVQNAVDQGKLVAESILGKAMPYAALPWFWSDQAKVKLQIAGLAFGPTEDTIRETDDGVSVFRFTADKLVAVETLNRSADHMAARRILSDGLSFAPAEAADPQFELRQALRR